MCAPTVAQTARHALEHGEVVIQRENHDGLLVLFRVAEDWEEGGT